MIKGKRCLCLAGIAFALVMGIAAAAHAMDVTLGWNANTETNLGGYKIYYGTTQGGPYNGTGSSNGTSPITVPLNSLSNPGSPEFTVHGLPDGKYYFVVTAFSTEGLESGYSNEVYTESSPSSPTSSTNPTNSAPVLSSLEVNGQTGSTPVYTDKRNVNVRVVASDDTLVTHYLILDGQSNPAGNSFLPLPGGPKQNPIITVNDFLLNDVDGSRTIYGWVKDESGLISAAASKSRVVLDRSTNVTAGTETTTEYDRIRGSEGDVVQDDQGTQDSRYRYDGAYTNPSSDQGGWANYEEYLRWAVANISHSGRKLRDAIEVVEAVPVDNLGMGPEDRGVQNKTGFSVSLDSFNGVDLSVPESVSFTIADGERTYTRKLNDLNGAGTKLLRAVVREEEGDLAYRFWAVYYRSNETEIPNTYPDGSVIDVTVEVTDKEGESTGPLTFSFRTQTEEERSVEAAGLPETSTTVDPLTSMKRTTITSGPLAGASIIFPESLAEEMGFEPYFGPLEDIPLLAGLDSAGMPLNLLPHTVFPSPVTLIIPCPEDEKASDLSVYYHDGRAWWLASDKEGNVTFNGDGWMAPGSRINLEGDDQGPDFIEIQVFHFSAAAAASPPAYTSSGGACFISSLWK
jgi:hypothetical protein